MIFHMLIHCLTVNHRLLPGGQKVGFKYFNMPSGFTYPTMELKITLWPLLRRPTGLLATLANYITKSSISPKMSLYPYSCINFDISIYQIARNFERNPMNISI